MQINPMEEWQRLTALYSEMSDIEIRELAAQMSGLTETAQQVLRDEMKKRGTTEKPADRDLQIPAGNSAAVHWQAMEDTAAEGETSSGDNDYVYTWKTALLRCDSIDEAAQRCEMLRRAGIDSWIQRPGARFVVPWLEPGVGDIQINVAADELDQARAVIAQPIPQEIINQMKEEESASDYELPVCPKCRAADPILESADPSNNWLCESCGHAWSDPLGDDETTRTTLKS